jgi:hypothetical protein
VQIAGGIRLPKAFDDAERTGVHLGIKAHAGEQRQADQEETGANPYKGEPAAHPYTINEK